MKLRTLLIASFSVIILIAFGFSGVVYWYFKKREAITENYRILDGVHLLMMKQFKLQNDFLLIESKNFSFYINGKSLNYFKQNEIKNQIIKKLYKLRRDNHFSTAQENQIIDDLINYQERYIRLFDNLVSIVKERGYKDYGLEGAMRDYAHELMRIKELNQENILMLRRHEKDFILRKEPIYVTKFISLIDLLKEEIVYKKLSFKIKYSLDSVVKGYSDSFLRIVSLEYKLSGKNDQIGMIAELNNLHTQSDDLILKIKKSAIDSGYKLNNEINNVVFVFLCIFGFVVIGFGIVLSNVISKSIILLNDSVTKFVESKFTIGVSKSTVSGIVETKNLQQKFYSMSEEIINYIKHFEQKVEERTLEINKQSNEILIQKQKIDDQYIELLNKNSVLENQKKELITIQSNIFESFRYAQRIQKAMMPSKRVINECMPDGFIYFQPRDIVSGDFYYIEKQNNKFYIVLADCTGHGVPGALLSIVGLNSIQKAISENKFEKASDYLDAINVYVEKTINNNEDNFLNDGMDIAFCIYDKDQNTLQYAGANLPLWYLTADDSFLEEDLLSDNNVIVSERKKILLKEFKADRQPIGAYLNRLPFSNNLIKLKKGDAFYIFTDGYADQFGGIMEKKFKYKRLKEMLIDIYGMKIEDQKFIVKDTLKKWKGDRDQIDDISVIGVKV